MSNNQKPIFGVEKNDLKTAKIVERQLKHFVTMINFNWECINCKCENSASLSEEEDLMQHDYVTETCRNCRANNRIKVYDIYNHNKD